MSEGIDKAWEAIGALDPAEVSTRALVEYSRGGYVLGALGMGFSIKPEGKIISGLSAEAEAVVKRLGYFFNHSVLWYLVYAKEIGATGRLVRPQNLSGGDIFFKGTHVLPLDALGGKYGADREGFLMRAEKLGAKVLDAPGDAAVELLPLPRVPVTIILWLADEEFPPRADLLMDSTCELHLPLDIIWCVAMYSVILML